MFNKKKNIMDKYEKCFTKINDEKNQKSYKDAKDMIRSKYEKEEKYKCLDNIRLEKERIEYNLEQINSQFSPIAISLLIMFFTLLIPAISKIVADVININLEYIIEILYAGVLFIYAINNIFNTVDEFRCLRICKIVLEELEKEKLEEIKNKSNEKSDDIKDIKKFLGI